MAAAPSWPLRLLLRLSRLPQGHHLAQRVAKLERLNRLLQQLDGEHV